MRHDADDISVLTWDIARPVESASTGTIGLPQGCTRSREQAINTGLESFQVFNGISCPVVPNQGTT